MQKGSLSKLEFLDLKAQFRLFLVRETESKRNKGLNYCSTRVYWDQLSSAQQHDLMFKFESLSNVSQPTESLLIVDALLNLGANTHVRTKNGKTVLDLAIAGGHHQIVERLVLALSETPNHDVHSQITGK